MLRSRRAWARVLAPLFPAVGVSCAASAPASAAASEPEAEVVSVTYAAGAACPTQERFLANVRRYTTKWRAAESGARVFRVVLEPRAADYRGTVVIEAPGAKPTRREITAADCDRVARGLAI